MPFARTFVALGLLALLTAAPTLRADEQAEVALQRKLDQPFDLKLQKVELAEAFKQIAATAKITLQIDPAAYNALPYGATTKVSADFRQSKLRDAIEEVLVPLGLQQSVSGDTVIIKPTGPLARIGRKAEWDELKLLQELRTTEIKNPSTPGFDWTELLRNALSRPGLVVALGTTEDPAAHEKAIDALRKQLPMTAYRALETYCSLTSQIWFVETGVGVASNTATVRIMPMKRWIYRQLERPIQISFTNAPLEKVVGELTHLSGIRIVPEPGLFVAIPTVSLNSNNGSVIQTLETLAGATAIAFEVRDDSILLVTGKQAASPSGRIDAIVGRISLPAGKDGNTVEMFIRESDLPAELNELRKKKLHEAVDGLKKAWAPPEEPASAPAPAPVPTSAPATAASQPVEKK